jgi:beta-galactosidase
VTNDYHLFFTQWAQTDIRAMVRRDRNHPCVVMWSIGNEISSPTVATGQNLRNWVRLEDTTRPVTWASNQMSNSAHQQVAAALDLAGYNYGESRYDGDHQAHPTWVIFGSETSSAVRSRGVYHTPVTQNILTHTDMQCSSYDNSVVSWGSSAENSYRNDVNRAFVGGQFIWTGFDYIGEPTPYGWPAKSSYFGIVDTCGFPKDIYYFYQSRWTTAPMVHILPHWNWSSGQTITVFVYTNCDSVELFLNNQSLGSRSFSGSAVHLEWSVAFASGTLRAEGRRGGSVVATDQVTTAGTAARVRLAADRGTIRADGEDLAYITTDILDANSVLVPTASNTVNFSISGPARLVGVDNGNAISTESYKGTSRQAFSGKCLAIVQSTGAAGQIVVTASSSGLTSGSVTINTQGPGLTATPTFTRTPTATAGPSPTPTPPPTVSPTTNLALNMPASADSEETGKGNIAANGNDGNTGTRWCANDGNTGHWWQVDLGSTRTLTASEVMWEFSGRVYRYRVEVSTDNTSWTTVVDKTGNTSTAQTQNDPFTANARFVRITVTGLPTSPATWASFWEFRVFGS